MPFEALANELFLDIFEYLDGVRLIRAFHDLNTRFNDLLLVHFQRYYFDFRSISKHEFDLICREYLPSVNGRVIHVCLSNDDETPMLFDIFMMASPTIKRFQKLRSLSLLNIHSMDKIYQMLTKSFDCTSQLTHLTITDDFHNDSNQFECLLNCIWSIPTLTHCSLDNLSLADVTLSGLSTVSLPMKRFSMKNLRLSVYDLVPLFKNTPNLQHLQAALGFDYEANDIPIISTKLTTLQLHIYFSDVGLLCLLQMIPFLRRLTLQIEGFYIDGHEWERLVTNYLPKIEIVQLQMKFESETESIDQLVESLMNTFRTPFWLDNHQWFVQCEWDSNVSRKPVFLYTLPILADDFYTINSKLQRKSTCSDKFFYSLQHIVPKIIIESDFDACVSKRLHFHRIESLKLTLPLLNGVSCIMSMFVSVRSLCIVTNGYTTLIVSQLESLINQAPCLYSLCVDECLALKLFQLKITNRSLRRLDCFQQFESFRIFFDTTECMKLAISVLGHQCEVLGIKVENHENILHLVRIMPNIRSLICECRRDKFNNQHKTTVYGADLLLNQLKEDLPRKCLVNRDTQNPRRIQCWIEK